MASKIYTFQMDLIYKLGFAPIKLVRGDTRSNIFNVTLTEENVPLDLTGSVVSITMDKPDETVVVGECQIVDALTGKIQYICGTNEIAALGTVLFTFEIYKEGGRVTTTQGKFKVVDQLDNGETVASFTDYPILGQLLSDLTTSENIRVADENTRIANENTRESNEDIRQDNEANRISTFTTNETNRINTFNANETIRQSNEDIRKSNEVSRVSEFNTLKTESVNATNYAINRGNYALEEGNNAKSAAEETRQVMANYEGVVEQTKKIYKESVATYDDIAITYPAPESGWTVQTKDTHIEYRWDGIEWVDIGVSDQFEGYNVYVGTTPPTNVNLLWVKTEQGESRLARILPSKTEPIDKNVIWWKID